MDRCIEVKFDCNSLLTGKKEASRSIKHEVYDYFPRTLVRVLVHENMSAGYILWGEATTCGVNFVSSKHSFSFARISFERIPVDVKPFQLFGKSYVSQV
jgi:hypothetical protein